MTALLLVGLGSLLAASVNLTMRKNVDRGGTSQSYLVIYFIFSFLSCFIFNWEMFQLDFKPAMFSVGLATGGFQFILMLILYRALKMGPPGLTFAFQNAGSVLPAVLLFFLFGPQFDFKMSFSIISGLGLVLVGLFWAANPNLLKRSNPIKSTSNPQLWTFSNKKNWMLCVVLVFLIQGFIFSIIQWRCLLIDQLIPAHPLIFLKCSQAEDVWFMPGFFTAAVVLNILLFLFTERRWFRLSEITLGSVGGFLNGVITFLLLVAAKYATGNEKPIIFPLFSISVIIICNLWGQRLYKEQINWKATSLCAAGIFIAAIL